MASTFAFTTNRVSAAVCPEGKNRVYFRDKRSPLWLAVTGQGAKSFLVYRKIHGKPVRVKIGSPTTVSLDAARREAERLVGEIAKGVDPRQAKRELRAGLTFEELFSDFIESWAKLRKKTWQDDEAQFERYLTAWKAWKLTEIQKHHVATLHARLGRNHGPYAANRLLALLHVVFEWAAESRGWKGGNPAAGIEKFPEKKRERFLQPAELPAFFKAVAAEPNETIRDFVLTALYVGARRSNVQAMAWAELDLDAAVWLIPDTKSGKSAIVPLCTPALDILKRRCAVRGDRDYVFPGRSRGHLQEPKAAWKKILERAGIEDLRLHDLRRTFGSFQAIGGSSLPIIGQSLGHTSTAATSIYARLHIDAVRKSIDAAVTAIVAAGAKQEEGKS
jgi:integrase